MTTSRERVIRSLNHQQPDRIPLDIGSTAVSGIAASSLHRLRAALGLKARTVRVHEPFQMLGKVEEDVLDALGIDVVGLSDDGTLFGYPAVNWQPFTMFDGTPVLVPGLFNTELDAVGDLYQYPQGDRSVPPSGRMPKGGFYFDAVERQEPYDPDHLDPEEWTRDMYSPLTDEQLRLLEARSRELYEGTTRAIIGNFGQGSFGDIALVPGLQVKHPKGIRAVAEWYMATALYPDYIHGIFQRQCDIAIQNLEKYHQAVGERIAAIFVSGTDFGSQRSAFISPRAYRRLFKPYHQRINDWIHEHTGWKTFFHSCGAMTALYDDFVEAGVDIVNPVQISAEGMAPETLKERWGDKLVFWGGGVDTQHVLPFGTPDEVRAHVAHNIAVFGQGGGFVFNSVHNIQAGVPTENLLALFEAFEAAR
jgi:hypothetical protein